MLELSMESNTRDAASGCLAAVSFSSSRHLLSETTHQCQEDDKNCKMKSD